MKFMPGMTEKEKVEALERIIIVHSIIYYELNSSVISDQKFDKLARLLAKKIQKHGEKRIRKTQYGYVLYDFDGTTGFDIMGRLNEKDKSYLTNLAEHVLLAAEEEVKYENRSKKINNDGKVTAKRKRSSSRV